MDTHCSACLRLKFWIREPCTSCSSKFAFTSLTSLVFIGCWMLSEPNGQVQEIKHTIQNKLHRNAGPEDLVATERMIERLEAEGGYNDAFMHEFRVFRAELRDFFNASSFTDMLDALRPSLDDADTPVSLHLSYVRLCASWMWTLLCASHALHAFCLIITNC